MIAIIAAPVYGGIDRGPVRSASMKSDPEFYPGGVWRDRPDALMGAFRRHGAHPKGCAHPTNDPKRKAPVAFGARAHSVHGPSGVGWGSEHPR